MEIYNSFSRRKEPLVTIEPDKLKIYACGPTVYDYSHIGHARVFIAMDVMVRYLRGLYEVLFVRNITDLDDKIIHKAFAERVSSQVWSERFTDYFHEDMAALNCLPPDVEPKVTEHIPHIIHMIEDLLGRGYAYCVDGDVYFAVERDGHYGELSGRALDDMEAGARVEVSDKKKHPMDFALWKAAKAGEPSWSSPWGEGRPGWHIECSAMSKAYLGKTFDIHAGGRDLIFPHHENERAQSENANHCRMANFWVHMGLVNINREKMSKSLGNFFTIREVLQKWDGQALRFYLLGTHYRSALDFSFQGIVEAEQRVQYFCETLLRVEQYLGDDGLVLVPSRPYRHAEMGHILADFHRAMRDDFNTPQVMATWSIAFRWMNEILDHPKSAKEDRHSLAMCYQSMRQMARVLGILEEAPQVILERMQKRRMLKRGLDAEYIQGLLNERQAARAAKNFAKADELRRLLMERGVVLQDSASGVGWSVMPNRADEP